MLSRGKQICKLALDAEQSVGALNKNENKSAHLLTLDVQDVINEQQVIQSEPPLTNTVYYDTSADHSSHACATLTINQIIGPDSVEITSADELILECDFEAQGEDDVVLKWFFNGLEDQIYQWIASSDQAYALGSLKDLIDPTYKVSDDPNSKFRALKFKEVSLALTGNYSCKVDSTDDVEWLAKQVIVYSPATSFEMFLIGGDDEFPGDEFILCDATNVSPKPKFNLFVSGVNGSWESPDMFNVSKKETVDHEGLYNVSITLPFNSSYLEDGTTKFVCQLSIPGTNYTETKSVEYFVDNGHNHLQSSLLLVLTLIFSLVLAT